METQIVDLHRLPQSALGQVAQLMTQGWPDHYGPDGAGDAPADVYARSQDTALPCGHAALRGDRVVGTVALARTSFGALDEGESPWLIGLIVAPDVRGQGVASQLCDAIARHAHELGYGQIFTTTQNARSLLHRAGWQDIRTVQEDAASWHVMALDLTSD